jgi:hypothetical protein
VTGSVNWWALALVFYILCGLGFTIQGIQRLWFYLWHRWERMRRDHAEVGARDRQPSPAGWRHEPSHQH